MNVPTSPTGTNHTLHLDTRVHAHAVDADGKLILSEATGKPITIAQDTISGVWYGLVADSFPHHKHGMTKAQREEAVAELVDAGGVHVAHDNELYRGVWVPLKDFSEFEETDGDTEATETPATPATKAAAKKAAAKKVAARSR